MDHSIPRIMILGQWSSDAFLVYIRPQVLEWANNMSEAMIKHAAFLDVSRIDKINKSNPRLCPPHNSYNCRHFIGEFPKFHLHH